MAVETESDKEMNLVGHLAELRNRLIVTAVFFIVFFIVAFIFVEDIYSFFEKDMDFVLNVTSPAEIIWVYLTMAGLAALVGTLPILALHVWLFIKPALTVPERRRSQERRVGK